MAENRRQSLYSAVIAEMTGKHGWEPTPGGMAEKSFAGIWTKGGEINPKGIGTVVLTFRGPVVRLVYGIKPDWSENCIGSVMMGDYEQPEAVCTRINAAMDRALIALRGEC